MVNWTIDLFRGVIGLESTLGYRIADQVGYLIFENFPPCSALFRCDRLLILTKNDFKLPYFLNKNSCENG